MGPAAPGTVGPQGPTGLKGDPGGFTTGTALSTNALNSIITPGIYVQSNGANVLTSANYPLTYNAPGILKVYQNGSTGIQEWEFSYATVGSRVVYRRNWNGSGANWNSWVIHNSSRIDQTAGRVIYQWDEINMREQLIYGDSGWRDLATVQLNGWTTTWCRLRRVGTEVTLVFFGMNSSVATADPFYILPVGFRAATGGYHQGYWFTDTTTNLGFLRLTGSGSLELSRRPATPWAANLQCVFKWTTDDTWPTTLPGVASGSIPNL
jgi:hypothetical protein